MEKLRNRSQKVMNEILSIIIPEGLEILPEVIVLIRGVVVFAGLELTTAAFALLGSFKK